MTTKEFISQVFSRKSSVAAIGIFALVYIATVSPGQLAVDGQANISLVPTAAGRPVDWKIPAEITLIACLAIIVQGMLDYFQPRAGKVQNTIDKILELDKLLNSAEKAKIPEQVTSQNS